RAMTAIAIGDMRVLVTGGRDYDDQEYVFHVLDRIHARRAITTLIEGGGRGADRLARRWAESRGVMLAIYPTDRERYGQRAGPVRKSQMLREGQPELVVAFEGGMITAQMVKMATKAGVLVLRAWPHKPHWVVKPSEGKV